MSKSIEQVRLGYLPAGKINVLFVAEAPPADSLRFFYFEEVATHDWLYLAIMRTLYQDARVLSVRELRRDKPDYLLRFKLDGYYLIDAHDEPMPPRATKATKRRLLRDSLETLVPKLQSVADADTRVVLISSAVHAICFAPLMRAGVQVINTEMIDFPAFGRQLHFRRKLSWVLDPFLHTTIRNLEESVRFFGAGKAQQKVRDRWVVEHFLHGLGLTFKASEIEQPEQDPPDATFRDAAFEVKEIQDRDRRRGDEYKQQLEKARAAHSSEELLEHYAPTGISIAYVYGRIMEETLSLAAGKYRVDAVRRSLDLLFYVNLGMRTAWGIDDGARPDIESLVLQGWRSVSFLHGTGTCCVIIGGDSAPDFLRSVQGKLIHGAVLESTTEGEPRQ